jgi:drug/metabolite transporter (DMT)-like permease
MARRVSPASEEVPLTAIAIAWVWLGEMPYPLALAGVALVNRR